MSDRKKPATRCKIPNTERSIRMSQAFSCLAVSATASSLALAYASSQPLPRLQLRAFIWLKFNSGSRIFLTMLIHLVKLCDWIARYRIWPYTVWDYPKRSHTPSLRDSPASSARSSSHRNVIERLRPSTVASNFLPPSF